MQKNVGLQQRWRRLTSIETNKKARVCIRASFPCMLTHVHTRGCAYTVCLCVILEFNCTSSIQFSFIYLARLKQPGLTKVLKKNQKIKNKIVWLERGSQKPLTNAVFFLFIAQGALICMHPSPRLCIIIHFGNSGLSTLCHLFILVCVVLCQPHFSKQLFSWFIFHTGTYFRSRKKVHYCPLVLKMKIAALSASACEAKGCFVQKCIWYQNNVYDNLPCDN